MLRAAECCTPLRMCNQLLIAYATLQHSSGWSNGAMELGNWMRGIGGVI